MDEKLFEQFKQFLALQKDTSQKCSFPDPEDAEHTISKSEEIAKEILGQSVPLIDPCLRGLFNPDTIRKDEDFRALGEQWITTVKLLSTGEKTEAAARAAEYCLAQVQQLNKLRRKMLAKEIFPQHIADLCESFERNPNELFGKNFIEEAQRFKLIHAAFRPGNVGSAYKPKRRKGKKGSSQGAKPSNNPANTDPKSNPPAKQ